MGGFSGPCVGVLPVLWLAGLGYAGEGEVVLDIGGLKEEVDWLRGEMVVLKCRLEALEDLVLRHQVLNGDCPT